MTRTQTMVQLSHDLVETLDQAAARRGTSRSALIRELLWEALQQDRDAVLGRQIAEGYRRAPQLEPDAWGELARAGDSSTEELLQRLDAEERAGGHRAW